MGELLDIYNAIMERDIVKVQKLIDQNKNCKTTIFHKLQEYVSTLSIEEQQNYKKQYKWYLASSKKYFKTTMSLIKEVEETGKLNFVLHGNLYELKNILKSFKTNFPDYSEQVDKILSIINNKQSENESIFLKDHDQDKFTSNYQDIFYRIYTSQNPVSVYKEIKWTQIQFYNNLKLFLNKYTNEKDKEIAEYLEQQFLIYMETYKKQSSNYLKYRELTQDEKEGAKKIVDDILASNKSLYEYCHTTIKYNVADLNRIIRIVFSSSKDESEILKKINAREDPNFQQEIDAIALRIMEDPNFNILQYYEYTKLSPEDFYNKTKIKNTTVSMFIGKNTARKYSITDVKSANFSIELALKMDITIKGKKITLEEKLMIFKYMEDNEIPINRFTYRACLDKLINDEIFKQKIYTYKGSI